MSKMKKNNDKTRSHRGKEAERFKPRFTDKNQLKGIVVMFYFCKIKHLNVLVQFWRNLLQTSDKLRLVEKAMLQSTQTSPTELQFPSI